MSQIQNINKSDISHTIISMVSPPTKQPQNLKNIITHIFSFVRREIARNDNKPHTFIKLYGLKKFFKAEFGATLSNLQISFIFDLLTCLKCDVRHFKHRTILTGFVCNISVLKLNINEICTGEKLGLFPV